MSIFSGIIDFFKGLFSKVRPGLENFLHKEKDFAIAELKSLWESKGKIALNEFKDEAFEYLSKAISDKLGHAVPDNWINILLGFAYEAIKAEIVAAMEHATK